MAPKGQKRSSVPTDGLADEATVATNVKVPKTAKNELEVKDETEVKAEVGAEVEAEEVEEEEDEDDEDDEDEESDDEESEDEVEDDEDDEIENAEAAVPDTAASVIAKGKAKAKAKAKTSPKEGVKAEAGADADAEEAEEEEDEDDEDDEDEESDDEDEESDEIEEDEIEEDEAGAKVRPSAKGKAKAKAKGKAVAKANATRNTKKANEEEDDDEEKSEAADENGESEEGEGDEAEEGEDGEPRKKKTVAPPPKTKHEIFFTDAQGRNSRLMIKQIVLTNFKSYGGRKVIGPFHKSFSSIVGPNGSGKSNTIDALLFVFGKRAKKMRLNKVSELIHGSSAMPDLQYAKVEVTFQDIIDTGEGPNDYEIVANSEVTVGRAAFRNNQSKYYLEGNASNFTDVTNLLRKRGVDLEHNRFLILQGEVEQIAMMKPKAQSPHEEGLLEYLEDIIGCNRYVEPIEAIEATVEQLTESRQERLNRLRVAERERESLDGPRKEAEMFVRAEAERLELQALVAQAEAKRSHAATKELEAQQKKLQVHMEEHRKKMEGFEKEVKAVEMEHNSRLKEYKITKENHEKADKVFKELEQQDVKLSEDIAFHEQKLQKLQQQEKKEAEAAVALVEDAERLKKDAPTREKELESAERFRTSKVAELEKVYESLKGKAEQLRPMKEAKEKELVPLQKRLTEVRKVVEVAQTEAQMLREKTSQVADEIEELKRQHADCSHRLKTREQELKDAMAQRTERVQLVADAKGRLDSVKKAEEEVSKEVATTRVKAEEARASFEQEHHRGRLIKSVYAASKAGKLKGVHGRLGDLGSISKKYDTAVTTACGMLDAIVVDSTEDAQALIEFVRSQDLGRTTCICLQKIKEKEQAMNQSAKAPEGVDRLLDLIKPAKPEYKVAFFFALGATLVADTLEQATRIGLQGKARHRVVTLDGKLIDSSGTMSGGGNHVAKGGMRASLCMFSPEEVKAMIDAYEKANARLAQIRAERRQLEEALVLTEKEIADLELREQKCTMDVSSLKKQIDAYDKRLTTLKVPTLTAGEKSKLKELEKLISSRAGELADIQEKHHRVEEEVRELHTQIMNIGGEELQTAKTKVEEATKKCEDCRKGIKKALLDYENMLKNAKKAEVSAKAAKADHAATEKALVKLREEFAALEDKAEAILNELCALKKSVEESDKILTELKTKRDDIIAAASAFKSQEVDLVNEMEEKTRALRELYGRITAWGNKLQEARTEYTQLPLDILKELRDADSADGSVEAGVGGELAQQAIGTDLADDLLETVVSADVEARMLTLEANLKNLKPNLASIAEFRRADAEYKVRLGEYDEVNNQREEARRSLEDLRQKRLEEFMDGFSIISMKLKEMYQMITLGGDAELELVDTLDPFSEGINFSVRPAKKSWKQITNLSGGEKTLASLSMVFALQHYRPTPLYFMDEIDAALDFRNVSIIANYIKERTKNAQFIVISLRNHMFEMSDLLVGIYKTSDISKAVAVTPNSFEVRVPASTPLQDANTMAALPAPPRNTGNKRPAPAPLTGPVRQAARNGA